MKRSNKFILGMLAVFAATTLSSCLRHEGYYGKTKAEWPAPSYSGYYGNKSYAWQNSSDYVSEYRRIFY